MGNKSSENSWLQVQHLKAVYACFECMLTAHSRLGSFQTCTTCPF